MLAGDVEVDARRGRTPARARRGACTSRARGRARSRPEPGSAARRRGSRTRSPRAGRALARATGRPARGRGARWRRRPPRRAPARRRRRPGRPRPRARTPKRDSFPASCLEPPPPVPAGRRCWFYGGSVFSEVARGQRGPGGRLPGAPAHSRICEATRDSAGLARPEARRRRREHHASRTRWTSTAPDARARSRSSRPSRARPRATCRSPTRPASPSPASRSSATPSSPTSTPARATWWRSISNGTAVLGLGNIGALAGKPVMEGKGVLFKRFADIDVFDIEVDTRRPRGVHRVRRRASSRPSAASTSRTSRPRSASTIEEQLQGADEHPGLPRRPARHGHHLGRRASSTRCELTGKKIEDVQGRVLRRRRRRDRLRQALRHARRPAREHAPGRPRRA